MPPLLGELLRLEPRVGLLLDHRVVLLPHARRVRGRGGAGAGGLELPAHTLKKTRTHICGPEPLHQEKHKQQQATATSNSNEKRKRKKKNKQCMCWEEEARLEARVFEAVQLGDLERLLVRARLLHVARLAGGGRALQQNIENGASEMI